MASELIKHTTDATFEADVLQSALPVLVDYWAEWCGPCKMIAPILDEVATGYSGKLQIAKMNVDENRDIPAKFGIRGIPTLMLFKNGELAATKVCHEQGTTDRFHRPATGLTFQAWPVRPRIDRARLAHRGLATALAGFAKPDQKHHKHLSFRLPIPVIIKKACWASQRQVALTLTMTSYCPRF